MDEKRWFELRDKKVFIDLELLGKATIVYDQVTDTIHINLSEEEPEETILLENGVIARIRNNSLIGLSIQGVSRYS